MDGPLDVCQCDGLKFGQSGLRLTKVLSDGRKVDESLDAMLAQNLLIANPCRRVNTRTQTVEHD